MIGEKVLCVLIGYLFGLIETGAIYGRLMHVDIKGQGSHNTGATNSLRVGGKKAGIIVLAGDLIKCLIPAVIAGIVFSKYGADARLYQLLAGFGAILGHNFPFYNGFKGGKGVACTCAIAFLVDWIAAAPALTVFIVIVIVTGYVSLGSMVAVACAGLFMFLRDRLFDAYGMSMEATVTFFVIWILITVLVVIRHKANIQRLMAGTENKMFKKKKD